MEKFIESQGYVIGGVYKIPTSKLEEILGRYEKEVISNLSKKYPNDTDLGKVVRKIIN